MSDSTLKGTLKSEATLHGKLQYQTKIVGKVYMPIAEKQDYYDASYRVIPSDSDQILLTEEKIMKQNLVVEKVPMYEVSNPQGGITVIIGGD